MVVSESTDIGSIPIGSSEIMFGWPSGLRQHTVNVPWVNTTVGSNPAPNAKYGDVAQIVRGTDCIRNNSPKMN